MEASIPKLSRGAKNPAEKLIKREEAWDKKSFKQMIRQMGLKVTHQRLAILNSLSSGRAHVTAQEVFEAVHNDFPDIGFATVYRFLRKLKDAHFVTEVRMGGMPARYELTPKRHHDHLTCTHCGKIVEFENRTIESIQETVARDNGFTLVGHVLELYGICSGCQN